jgi:hypothetical protein
MGMTKKVWNFFTIAQWEEEEQWLNEMARNGYNLIGVKCFVRYIFEQGTPGEYIYKLDLPDNLEHGMDDKAYCNFLAECGIDVVCKQKQWLFLRKKAADGPFNEQGDMFAKLKMTNKAYSYAIRTLSMLLKGFTIFICLNLFAMVMLASQQSAAELLEGVVMGVGIGSTVALTIVWVPLINRLRKRMNELVDEIAINR